MPGEKKDQESQAPSAVSSVSLFKSQDALPATNTLAGAWKYDQGAYTEQVKLAMNQGLDVLKNATTQKKLLPLSELYYFLSQKRQEIAVRFMPKGDELGPASDFGQPRRALPRSMHNPGITFIPKEGRYAAMYPALVNKLKNLQTAENDCVRVVTYGRYDDCFMKNAFVIKKDNIVLSALGFRPNLFFTDIIHPEPVPYGRHHDDCLTGAAKTKYLEEHTHQGPEQEYPTIAIIHPSAEDIQKAFEVINQIYVGMVQEQKADADLDKTVENIAAIAWWLSQAMACKRGNASITEMVVGILFKQFGIEYKPYVDPDGLSLDLKAIFEPDLSQFIVQFKQSYGFLEEPKDNKVGKRDFD